MTKTQIRFRLFVVLFAGVGCGGDDGAADALSGDDSGADVNVSDASSMDSSMDSSTDSSMDSAAEDGGGIADAGDTGAMLDSGEADVASDSAPAVDAGGFNPPAFTTSGPVIHLADNLDEENGVGYCIDTIGRGFGDRLHAHSCKPAGSDEDVRYSFSMDSGQIESAGFGGFCVEILDGGTDAFGLVECDASNSAQRFDYDSSTLEFHPRGDTSMCMSVGRESRPAGLWMARDLLLEACDELEARYKSWVIFDE